MTHPLSIKQRDLRELLAEIGQCTGQGTRPVPGDEYGRRILQLTFECEDTNRGVAVEIEPDGAVQWVISSR